MASKGFLAVAILAAAFASAGVALAGDHPATSEHPKTEHPAMAEHPATPGDIVAALSGVDSLKTLLGAVKAAGLLQTLQGEGPFTVFAPTDAAFAQLPTEMLEGLLKPENKKTLTAILAYHVVPGAVMAADVKKMKVKTINGQEASITVEDGSVMVDKAKVIAADIAAGNGVIHVIDSVLRPAVPVMNPETAKPKDHPGH
jgi:uncharacterized surface protein with fasciclin (FAS1) repeats